MTTNGLVNITIVDNGGSSNVQIPAASLVCVAGVSSIGTAAQPMSTRSVSTLISSFGYGPLVELCAILIALGATVIATKLTQSAAGTATAVTATGTGTSICTVTLDGTAGAFDTYNVKIVFTRTGTIGTAGYFTVSLDAGRNAGGEISLGTATTYLIPGTGITLNFAAGTNVSGDTRTFSTVEPVANTTARAAWLTAMSASVFAQAGWGNMIAHGAITGANAATIQTTADTLATGQLFERMMFNWRDGAQPVAWGGAGETEAAWQALMVADGTTARRVLMSAGFYNMAGAIPNSVASTPRLRRPASWAIMARKVAQAVQVLSSRVSDGPLASIIVDQAVDPTDGFVYHDERTNPGGDAARFATLWTRLRLGQGFFVRSENLMSPPGSDFDLMAVGQCFDNFCGVVAAYFTQKLDISVRANANGTIYENDAKTLESGFITALEGSMAGQYNPALTTCTVDRLYNVKSNKKALVTAVMDGLTYIREFDITAQIRSAVSA